MRGAVLPLLVALAGVAWCHKYSWPGLSNLHLPWGKKIDSKKDTKDAEPVQRGPPVESEKDSRDAEPEQGAGGVQWTEGITGLERARPIPVMINPPPPSQEDAMVGGHTEEQSTAEYSQGINGPPTPEDATERPKEDKSKAKLLSQGRNGPTPQEDAIVGEDKNKAKLFSQGRNGPPPQKDATEGPKEDKSKAKLISQGRNGPPPQIDATVRPKEEKSTIAKLFSQRGNVYGGSTEVDSSSSEDLEDSSGDETEEDMGDMKAEDSSSEESSEEQTQGRAETRSTDVSSNEETMPAYSTERHCIFLRFPFEYIPYVLEHFKRPVISILNSGCRIMKGPTYLGCCDLTRQTYDDIKNTAEKYACMDNPVQELFNIC